MSVATTIISPPAGAPKSLLLVWIRPDVHEEPLRSGTISRFPSPSSRMFAVEAVFRSISPVPNVP